MNHETLVAFYGACVDETDRVMLNVGETATRWFWRMSGMAYGFLSAAYGGSR